MKSWYTTPRNPEEADPPRIVAVTDTTGMHHIHTYIHTYRIPGKFDRLKVVYIHTYIHACMHTNIYMLIFSYAYIHTYIHTYVHTCRPSICGIASRSMSFFWFAQNPKTFGSPSSTFEIQCEVNGRVGYPLPYIYTFIQTQYLEQCTSLFSNNYT